MGKSYKRLSADIKSADVLVNAILALKYKRVFDKKPVEELLMKLDGVSNFAEAGRICDYLIADRILIKDGKRFVWHGDVSVWDNPDKRRTYCLQMLHHSREDMPEIIQKSGSKKSILNLKHQKTTVKISPKQDNSPKVVLYGCDSQLDFSSHSDDELSALLAAIQKEFARREEIRKKQAKLQEVLELADMSRDELAELLGVI